MGDKKLEFTVSAKTDDAEKDIDALADTVEGLEKAKPEIKVTADVDKAKAEIKDIDDLVKDMTDDEKAIVIKATADEARKAARDIEASLKRIDDPVELRVEAGRLVAVRGEIDKLEGKLDELGDAGKKARRGFEDIGNEVGPFRDVSGAIGGMGSATLDAAEGITGLGQSLEQLGGKAGQIGAALGKIGFVGAIAALALEGAATAINFLNGSTNDTTKGLKAMTAATGQSGKGFDQYSKGVANSVDATDLLSANVLDLGNKLQGFFGQKIPDAGDRMKAFNKVLEESAPAASALIKELEKTGTIDVTELEKMKGLLDEQQRSGAILANENRELEATQELYNQAVARGIKLQDEAGQQRPKSDIQAQVAEMLLRESVSHQTSESIASDEERIAAAMTAASGARQAGWVEDKARADDLRGSIEQLNDELDKQRGAVLGEAEARVRQTEAQARYNEQVKEGKSSVDELTVAAIDVAEAYADVLETQAKANGQSFTTEQRNRAIQASLQTTADKATKTVKPAIQDLINKYDEVPDSVHTNASLNADQALAELNALIRKLQIAQQEIDIMKAKAARIPITVPGVPGFNSTTAATSTTIVNVPPTLDPNRVLSAVTNGQRRNGSLRRG